MDEAIKTLIFLDLETSGLPQDHPVKITEISLVAANRDHILDIHSGITKENNLNCGFLPRVLNKVSFTIHPSKLIQPMASTVSGLTNDILEHQKPFNENLCGLIDLYLERLEKPACLIAHNGFKFDFPILQSELFLLGKSFPEDIFCVDSLVGFREVLKSLPEGCSKIQSNTDDILSHIKPLDPVQSSCTSHQPKSDWSNEEFDSELGKVTEIAEKITRENNNFNAKELEIKLKLEMEKIRIKNENTPVRNRIHTKDPSEASKVESQVRRKILKEKQPKRLYNLKSLYESLTKKELVNAHRAESDALALLECVAAVGRPFIEWVDRNKVPFRSIRRMW